MVTSPLKIMPGDLVQLADGRMVTVKEIGEVVKELELVSFHTLELKHPVVIQYGYESKHMYLHESALHGAPIIMLFNLSPTFPRVFRNGVEVKG